MRLLLSIATAALLSLAGCAAPEVAARKWELRGGMIHDGVRAHFPLEIYGIKTESDYRIARFIGFDAVCDDGPRAFLFSKKYGMMLTLPNWFDSETTEDFVRTKVRAFRGNESIVAWNLADEPDLRAKDSPPETLSRFARIVREEDPHRLVSVTLSGARGAHRLWAHYASAADVLRLDPYPVAEGAGFRSVHERLTLGRRLAGSSKSMWVVLQAWRGEGARLPTPSELRLSAFLALVDRARGLSVFDFNLDTWAGDPEFLEALLRVTAEARRIRALALPGKSFKATTGADDVVGREWIAGGRRLLALVNVGDKAHTIDLATRALGFVRIDAGGVYVHTWGNPLAGEGPAWRGAAWGNDIFDPDANVYAPDRDDGRLLLRNTSDASQEITVPDADAHFYVCDLHGDRWQRLALDARGRLLLPPHATVEAVTTAGPVLSPSETAFVDRGLSIQLTGGNPIHEALTHSLKRHLIHPGEPLTLTCLVTGRGHIKLDATLARYGTPFQGAVSVEPIKNRSTHQTRFHITLRLPADAPADVDYELTLTLSWRRFLRRHRIERIVRIRKARTPDA